jgi:hypothetical protein
MSLSKIGVTVLTNPFSANLHLKPPPVEAIVLGEPRLNCLVKKKRKCSLGNWIPLER